MFLALIDLDINQIDHDKWQHYYRTLYRNLQYIGLLQLAWGRLYAKKKHFITDSRMLRDDHDQPQTYLFPRLTRSRQEKSVHSPAWSHSSNLAIALAASRTSKAAAATASSLVLQRKGHLPSS